MQQKSQLGRNSARELVVAKADNLETGTVAPKCCRDAAVEAVSTEPKILQVFQLRQIRWDRASEPIVVEIQAF